MPTHQQFLTAITATPEDVALRLQYADWLEEQGNPLCHEWRKPMVRIRVEETETSNRPYGMHVPGFGDGLGIFSFAGFGNGKGCGRGSGSIIGSFTDFDEHSGDGTGGGTDEGVSLLSNDFRHPPGDGSGDGHAYGYGYGRHAIYDAGDGEGHGFIAWDERGDGGFA